jgi:biopolymer transport protein ExbB
MFPLFLDFMDRGGAVMWPLLVLSFVAVALSVERGWFWLQTNKPGRVRRLVRITRAMRQGKLDEARELARGDESVYGQVAQQLLDEGAADAVVIAAVEAQRPSLERFMPTLSTIITAAPMLGILGTVLGIISSFSVLSQQSSVGDTTLVSQGIAEALLTTAFGLVIAIAALLPYNACRAQIDRTLGRIETLTAAAGSVKSA